MFAMKAMKTCKMGCGGKMKSGGAVSKIKKMKTGGQNIVGMPGYNATIRPMQMKDGGAKSSMVDAVKMRCPPGTARLANGGCGQRPLYGG
jgi:hypothetical protein